MELNTASAVISFAKKLERDAAEFYENLSQIYAKDGDVLLSFAKESRKNAAQVERVYNEVITDALEGCFSFNIDPDKYTFQTGLAKDISYSDALGKALVMEQNLIRFYLDAAEQSKSLMADVPRVFALIAKRKENDRIPKLRSLLGKGD